MLQSEEWFDLAFDSFKKVIFPESWLKLDISLAKQDLLALMLIEKMGESTMSQIAEQLNFPMSTTTGIVDRLVKKNLALRIRSDSDRRIVYIKTSDEGTALSKDFKDKIQGIIANVSKILDDQEMAVLLKLISRINDIFEGVTDRQEQTETKESIQKINID